MGPDKSINKFGGVGKTPYGPTKDNLSPLALNPGPKSNLSKADFESLSSQIDDYQSTLGNLKSATKAPTVGKTPTGAKGPTVRINKQGGVGSKQYGPAAPTKATTATKTTSAKTGGAKTGGAKTAKKGGAKTGSKKTGEESLQAGIPTNVTAKYKYATEADKPFLQTLNAAQQEIAKQGPKMRQYTLWLNSPNTQATLRRLRTGK